MWARIEKTVVREIIEDIPDFPIGERFPAAVVEQLVPCSSDVMQGWIYDGTSFEPPAEPADDLDEVKRVLKGLIDNAAEGQRLRYITAGAGQAMTYAQKANEARLCLAEADPNPAHYPLLAAEVSITAATLTGVAQVVATANAQWLQIGAGIETARLAAKKAVTQAETRESAQAAVEAIVWPDP